MPELNKKMLLRVVIVCLVIIVSSGCGDGLDSKGKPDSRNTALVGTWIGESADGWPSEVTFDADGKITIASGASAGEGTYTADFSFTPAHLDIDGDWTEGKTVTTIIEFVDDNTIRVEDIAPGDARPTEFSERVSTFTRK